jgi:phosphoserine phosphatase RsbU/P
MFKILVIDDDPVTRRSLEKTLQSQGYEVCAVDCGAAGIKQAQKWQPALIICDWLMPEVDGLEVCRQLKANPDLVSTFFILLTVRSQVADRIKALDAGVDDILAKPIGMDELLARVRAGLRLYQSNQSLHELATHLHHQKQRLEADLAEAADYITSLLPQPLMGGIRSEAVFLPCKQLGGDCFDYYWLDPDYLMLYLLDVSGHGLGSALLSVSIQNLIRSQSLPGINFYRPEDVLRGLNEVFQMDEQHSRYFTLWYGVYNRVQRRLTYASAGHPPALLMSGQEPSIQVQQLKTPGKPIGMLPDARYVSASCTLLMPSRLLLFSDGLYEIRQPGGKIWNLDRLITWVTQQSMGDQSAVAMLRQIQSLTGATTFDDDISLLQFRFDG